MDDGHTTGWEANEEYALTQEQLANLSVNDELAKAAGEMRTQLSMRRNQLDVVDRFFVSQFGKAQRTFVAIHTLLRSSLIEDALCLLRVLVENTINLQYAIKSGPVEAVRRYWDWAMLDAIRRSRASDWFEGTGLWPNERKESFLRTEAEIKSRYRGEEFKKLKRDVFGIPLESRAKIAGLSQLYTNSYRVTSRNVHAMDLAVLGDLQSGLSVDEYNEFCQLRASHVLEIAQWCLGTLTIWVNGQFQCGFDDHLRELQERSPSGSL